MLTVVRTPALYLAAKQAGIIQQVKPKLDALRASRFHLRDEHYRVILHRAGEL
jgi:predicted nucleic acid-binding protein